MTDATPENASQPDLTIVYINRGMGDMMVRSLKSLTESAPKIQAEVVVVHCPGRDEPDLEDRCKEQWPGLIWKEIEQFGIALMRNVGIATGRGRYYVMLDADTLVKPGCFDALVKFMDEHEKAAGCGPRTVRPDGEMEYSAKRFYTFWTIVFRRTVLRFLWPNNPLVHKHLMLDCNHQKTMDIDWMAGACYMMRGETVEHIGNFDESFYFGFEDVDWCYRAKVADWKIYYVPGAEIVHDVQRSSARGFNRMMFEHLKSGIRFWRKHRRTPKPKPAEGNI
jgi:GT2 family glycosyltransferase